MLASAFAWSHGQSHNTDSTGRRMAMQPAVVVTMPRSWFEEAGSTEVAAGAFPNALRTTIENQIAREMFIGTSDAHIYLHEIVSRVMLCQTSFFEAAYATVPCCGSNLPRLI